MKHHPKTTAELTAANIEPAITPAAARFALGGISRATEFRMNRSGTLVPIYVGGRKLYSAATIREIVTQGAS